MLQTQDCHDALGICEPEKVIQIIKIENVSRVKVIQFNNEPKSLKVAKKTKWLKCMIVNEHDG